jgi:hypothetical protein
MTTKMGIREGAASAIVFSVVLFALVSVDPRVKSQVSDTLRSGSASSLGHRATDIGSALWSAARDKSLDNAPVRVFATVGAVLTVFMLRT